MEKTNGYFISFEGIEGVGKSTLQKTLAQELQLLGYDVVLTREPGGTLLAEDLRNTILAKNHEAPESITELLVMFAARAQHVAQVIKPAIAAGKIVLCDRFTDSSMAYQGGGRQMPVEWIKQLANMVHPDTNPHLTFWLDLPVEQALSRAKARSESDRIESEAIIFFERARAQFEKIAKEEPQRVVRLDASLPPELLKAEALGVLISRL